MNLSVSVTFAEFRPESGTITGACRNQCLIHWNGWFTVWPIGWNGPSRSIDEGNTFCLRRQSCCFQKERLVFKHVPHRMWLKTLNLSLSLSLNTSTSNFLTSFLNFMIHMIFICIICSFLLSVHQDVATASLQSHVLAAQRVLFWAAPTMDGGVTGRDHHLAMDSMYPLLAHFRNTYFGY